MKVSFNKLRTDFSSSWKAIKSKAADLGIKAIRTKIDDLFFSVFDRIKDYDLRGASIGIVRIREAIFFVRFDDVKKKWDITDDPALISNSYNFELLLLALDGDKTQYLTIPQDEYPAYFREGIERFFGEKLIKSKHSDIVTVTPKPPEQELNFDIKITIMKF
jgi:hypothetical protein